jgi:hypothetical protein
LYSIDGDVCLPSGVYNRLIETNLVKALTLITTAGAGS